MPCVLWPLQLAPTMCLFAGVRWVSLSERAFSDYRHPVHSLQLTFPPGFVQRVVVIVASVLFFRNPMTQQSAISTAVALFGVAAYSQAKRVYKSRFVSVKE
jgi:uncharacterized membrane protein (GlpM family)